MVDKKVKGYVRGVNAKRLPIHGFACGADIRVRLWTGKVNIIAAPLDDRKFYLGMDFLERAKDFMVPYGNTLFSTTNGQLHEISMR